MKNLIYLILIGIGLQLTVGCGNTMLETEITESPSFQAQWVEVPSNEGLEDSYNDLNPEDAEEGVEKNSDEEPTVKATEPDFNEVVAAQDRGSLYLQPPQDPGLEAPNNGDPNGTIKWEAQMEDEEIEGNFNVSITHQPLGLKGDSDAIFRDYGVHPGLDQDEDHED